MRQVEFVLDEMMECMFEGTWRQLSFEVNGQEAGGRIDMFEPCHKRTPFRSDRVRTDQGVLPKFRPSALERQLLLQPRYVVDTPI